MADSTRFLSQECRSWAIGFTLPEMHAECYRERTSSSQLALPHPWENSVTCARFSSKSQGQ